MSPDSTAVAILGCTGSIGDSTFDVIESLGRDRFPVVALSAGRRVEKLVERALAWGPRYVCVADGGDETRVRENLPSSIAVLSGVAGLREIAAIDEIDVVVNGLVGAAGLLPTLDAVRAGKKVAMANKEPLVMAGGIILDAARAHGGEILPIDSEPSAIWQCLHGEPRESLKRIVLTASGGPFRGLTREQMFPVTPQQALAHPTWKMGNKITVDSATLMNKGFEVIEASWLFDVEIDQIDVIVHRESVVHSMVEFADGSWLAHLGKTDMKLPIQYALTHPGRQPATLEALDLIAVGALHFEEPDWTGFPCLRLCGEAGRTGGCAPAALNAADEVAVAAFLEGRIGFLDIYEINREVCEQAGGPPVQGDAASLDDVLEADRDARRLASAIVGRRARRGDTTQTT